VVAVNVDVGQVILGRKYSNLCIYIIESDRPLAGPFAHRCLENRRTCSRWLQRGAVAIFMSYRPSGLCISVSYLGHSKTSVDDDDDGDIAASVTSKSSLIIKTVSKPFRSINRQMVRV